MEEHFFYEKITNKDCPKHENVQRTTNNKKEMDGEGF